VRVSRQFFPKINLPSTLEGAILSKLSSSIGVHKVDSNRPSTQRRRSERVSKSVPLIVRGIDLLGQPFEERTSTVTLNLHGCRYSSHHHLPKNTWVTLEVPDDAERRNVRARVAWIQRPHSVREFFQVAVELESPADIWNLDSPPAWETEERSIASQEFSTEQNSRQAGQYEAGGVSETAGASAEGTTINMTDTPSDFVSGAFVPPASSQGQESSLGAESPLLREWSAELERRANRAGEAAAIRAAEQVHHAMDEFELAQNSARRNFSAEIGAKQEEFLNGLRSQFEGSLQHARGVLNELERGVQALRAENEAALESTSRIAQAQLQLEAAHAARPQQPTDASNESRASIDGATAQWRERLESEMALAQAQWNELLQSSLDGSIERLVTQLSGRSQDVLRDAEQKMSERFAEIRQPLGQLYSEARETLSGVKAALEQEVGRARFSLNEIEHAATRMKEYSAQLEAASHDTLNELHRRLENILEAQTDEMNRRAENVAASVPQRVAPALDALGHEFVERTMGEVQSKLTARIERIPELLRELDDREIETEDSLRLYRERLRQAAENNHRDVAGQMAGTLAGLRQDFESARKEALSKWSEELDTTGVRATHAAAESIGRSSEWFQQEARARLQVLVEQTLVTAGSGFEAKTAEGFQKFESHLEDHFNGRVAQIQQQLDGVAGEITGRTRTQLDAAAELAAASFGQVVRNISDAEVGQFAAASRNELEERQRELKRFSEQLVGEIQASGGGLIDRFREQMASQLQTSVDEGRSALVAEFASALEAYRSERDAHDKQWAGNLDRVCEESAQKYHERLQAACDSWVVSSVRRLNEHGQNVVESLMRSADQSLRDSCSRVFDGLSEMLRDRATSAVGVAGFTPGSSLESTETPGPHNQAASKGASA